VRADLALLDDPEGSSEHTYSVILEVSVCDHADGVDGPDRQEVVARLIVVHELIEPADIVSVSIALDDNFPVVVERRDGECGE